MLNPSYNIVVLYSKCEGLPCLKNPVSIAASKIAYVVNRIRYSGIAQSQSAYRFIVVLKSMFYKITNEISKILLTRPIMYTRDIPNFFFFFF